MRTHRLIAEENHSSNRIVFAIHPPVLQRQPRLTGFLSDECTRRRIHFYVLDVFLLMRTQEQLFCRDRTARRN
jgi:hypothetical protein